ncbi:twitching motility protein PilT [Brucella endophytica]|uniref:Twitching motility protein PilT n=1 Tax=Brucella endophytica TaxID=1963359 RepID=A0A916S674_9HYPH|nr:type II toxin-antitoxin system VapC family toxin [Brucella endophytica]GGA82573.1 twitching motility protein PilT [Brucella endophytica]
MFLLDTNVVSELRKIQSGKAHPSLVAWNEAVNPAELFLSVIVLHELEMGVRKIERLDRAAGKILRGWLEESVMPAFSGRILALDEAAAIQAAEWHIPNPKTINDAYIAATAYVRRMTIVTRNVRDFSGMDVTILNPWEDS